jgi:hypothetical protein
MVYISNGKRDRRDIGNGFDDAERYRTGLRQPRLDLPRLFFASQKRPMPSHFTSILLLYFKDVFTPQPLNIHLRFYYSTHIAAQHSTTVFFFSFSLFLFYFLPSSIYLHRLAQLHLRSGLVWSGWVFGSGSGSGPGFTGRGGLRGESIY